MDGDCLPCATLWRRRTPDSALTHCHSAHCPLHSTPSLTFDVIHLFVSFSGFDGNHFALRPRPSVCPRRVRPFARPLPSALSRSLLTQFLPAMLHQRFLLLLLRRVLRGPSAVRPRVDGNGIKKRPVRAAPFRTGSSGNRGGLGETDDGRRV